MRAHYKSTGNPFEISPQTITVVWPTMVLEGTEVCRDSDRVYCYESLDEMQELLKAAGMKFARVQFLDEDWAYCLINPDKIRYLEAIKESTKIQVGHSWCWYEEITVNLPLEQVLNLLVEARGDSRKNGTWLKDDIQNHVELTYHCSECGFEAWGENELTKYCGGCGAQMNREET